jgi:hypothetical protein
VAAGAVGAGGRLRAAAQQRRGQPRWLLPVRTAARLKTGTARRARCVAASSMRNGRAPFESRPRFWGARASMPSLAGGVLTFVSEGDVWRADPAGGAAARLTSQARSPRPAPAFPPRLPPWWRPAVGTVSRHDCAASVAGAHGRPPPPLAPHQPEIHRVDPESGSTLRKALV